MKRRGNRHKQSREKKSFKFYFKKFFFWFIAYFIFISLLTILFKNTQIYQNKIGFYIIMGYLLVLLSRVFYSATKQKSFRLNGIIVWGLIYTVVFGVLDYFLTLIPKIQINSSYDLYISIAIFSILFTIIIMFLRRMKIKSRRHRAPSQIFSGIILLVSGILVLRFSYTIFVGWFGWLEGLGWSWLIGWGLIVAGVLVLIAWWRNNVLSTGKHFGLAMGKKHKI